MRSRVFLPLLLVLACGALGPVAWAEPQLSVTSPSSGETLTDQNVQVAFQVSGINVVPSSVPVSEIGKHPELNRPGEGHLHLMLDLEPLVLWFSTDPATLSEVRPGPHRLMVEVVENDHSSFSPPVAQEVRFEVAPRELPNTGGEPSSMPAPALAALGVLAVAAGGLMWRYRRVFALPDRSPR